MQLLQTPKPRSLSIELSVIEEPDTASRHDAQIFTARAVPTDPYTAWLEEREADRGSSAVPV
jgi:hypothetical protein